MDGHPVVLKQRIEALERDCRTERDAVSALEDELEQLQGDVASLSSQLSRSEAEKTEVAAATDEGESDGAPPVTRRMASLPQPASVEERTSSGAGRPAVIETAMPIDNEDVGVNTLAAAVRASEVQACPMTRSCATKVSRIRVLAVSKLLMTCLYSGY